MAQRWQKYEQNRKFFYFLELCLNPQTLFFFCIFLEEECGREGKEVI